MQTTLLFLCPPTPRKKFVEPHGLNPSLCLAPHNIPGEHGELYSISAANHQHVSIVFVSLWEMLSSAFSLKHWHAKA